MSLLDDLSDPTLVGRGRQLAHAPWGAFADAEAALAGAPSPWRRSLDGAWRFHLAARPDQAPAGSEAATFDDARWAALPVPSNWELHGHGEALYCNIAYPFPPDPPHPPVGNPTGCYRTWFEVPPAWSGRRVFLRFGAVDSAFHCWLNGEEVGFSTDSKLPAEFDVTAKLKPGRNLLSVRCYRWGASAYLEKQDYWNLSGIQRSVELVAKAETHLRDWAVRTTLAADGGAATVSVRAWMSVDAQRPSINGNGAIDYPGVAGWSIAARLHDPEGALVGEVSGPVARRSPMYGGGAQGVHEELGSAAISLAVAGPRAWTAETPALYTLVLTLRSPDGTAVDHERVRVGIRQVDIRDGVILLNGRRLVVRGVNRHEFHPERGRAVTEADMREDLVAMKRLNFNAVRTCHYPDDERWYDLCDELGMYVVDEANLETHGLEAQTSRDPLWSAAYLQRAVRMLLRDRNHACVVAWSLGNESYVGPHHAAMAAWIRAEDPTRPVQYESGYPGAAVTDILAPMYPALDWVRRELARPDEKRPMVMCEYAYAKGNSTGNFRKFWDLVDELPRFQGGFVWDWRDKALPDGPPDAEGRQRWRYGERKDEAPNVERMCLNGVVGLDLTPHPGAYEIRDAQAPVRVTASSEDLAAGRVQVRNSHHVLGLSHLQLEWVLHDDGGTVLSGRKALAPRGELPAGITAGQTVGVVIVDPAALPPLVAGRHRWLDWRFTLALDTPWASKGHVVAAGQLAVGRGPEVAPVRLASLPAASLAANDRGATIRGQGVELRFDRALGALASLCLDGRELLARPLQACFFRAPTDIDQAIGEGGFAHQWRQAGLDRLVATTESFTASAADGVVTVRIAQLLTAEGTRTRIRRETSYRVHGSGDLIIDELVLVEAAVATLPRIGLVTSIPGGGATFAWLGRGPHENYPDRKLSSPVGMHRAPVRDLLEPYLYPQECGLRCDVRWATVVDGGVGLLVQGLPTLHVSALPVRLEDLDAAVNAADLRPRDETALHLDGFHMGLGGDTGWHQNVHPEFRLEPGRYRWSVRLRPLRSSDDAAGVASAWLEGAPR